MKQFTFILGAAPYGGQDVDTLLGMAQTALRRGHKVAVAFYVDEASLRERGLGADDLVESLVPVGREKISALWAEHRLQMLF